MPSSYENILIAARTQNTSLLQLELEKACIDVWKPGSYYFSAASQLASENNREGVEFLRQHGAHINYIALGAAVGRHHEYAKLLIQQGADVNYVALGASIVGDGPYVRSLIDYDIDIGVLAIGFGIGGHQDYWEALKKVQSKFIDDYALGIGISGAREAIGALKLKGVKLNNIAVGLGIGGNETYAEELRKEGADINFVAFGAAKGGAHIYADSLLKKGAKINSIAEGACVGGHREYAELLRQAGANINTMALNASLGGHFQYAEWLIQQGAKIEEVIKGVVAANFLNNERSALNFLLSFNEPIRSELIRSIRNWPNWSFNDLNERKPIDDNIKFIAGGIESIAKKIQYFVNIKRKHQLEYFQLNSLGGTLSLYFFVVLLQVLPQLQRSHKTRPALPLDIIFNLAYLIFPSFSKNELLAVQRSLNSTFLHTAIEHYKVPKQSFWNCFFPPSKPPHLDRAVSFQAALRKKKEEASLLCQHQLSFFAKDSQNNNSSEREIENVPAHEQRLMGDLGPKDDFYKALMRTSLRGL